MLLKRSKRHFCNYRFKFKTNRKEVVKTPTLFFFFVSISNYDLGFAKIWLQYVGPEVAKWKLSIL